MTESATSPSPPIVRTSHLLRQLIEETGSPSIKVEELFEKLRSRSFGGILLLLSVLSLIPGIAFVIGLIAAVIGYQLAAGFKTPRLPRFITEKRLDLKKLNSILKYVIPVTEKLELYVKPRLPRLSKPLSLRALGGLIVILAMLITVPLPFTNIIPAISLLIIALGVLEKDGALLLAGITVAAFALVLGYFIVYFVVSSAASLL